MSKSQRLEALTVKIDEIIEPALRRIATKVLLWMFIKGFKIKHYYEDSTGLVRAWYLLIAIPLFLYGFVLDVIINSTVGEHTFPDAYEFGTLTATMSRIKKIGPIAENYLFAVMVCEVLSDYDEGHC